MLAPHGTALVDRIFYHINETDLPKFLFEVWALAQYEPYAADLVDDMYAGYRSILAKLLPDSLVRVPPTAPGGSPGVSTQTLTTP